jgi:hypothetical protein
VQALVDERPHPAGILLPPFGLQLAGGLKPGAVLQHLRPHLVEAGP